MKFFLTGLCLAFAQRIRSFKFWCILLLLPVLILTVQTALPKESVTAPVQVGVALPASGGEGLMELLEQRNSTVMTFIPSSPDTIDRNVASGKWDCGLILPEDFHQRLENLDTYRLISLRISNGSAVYPLVQETVASCMSILSSGQIAKAYLLSSGIVTDAVSVSGFSNSVDITDQIKEVEIHMRTIDGAQLDALSVTERGVEKLLLWVISAFMAVWMLLRVVDLGITYHSGAFCRMRSVRSATAIFAGTASADLISICAFAMISMAILGAQAGCYLAVCIYGVFLCAFALMAAHMPAVWKSIPIFPPFVVLISLLFTGTLVEMGTLFPQIAPVLQWMPGRLFLQICQGDVSASLPLIAASSVFIAVSMILDRTK